MHFAEELYGKVKTKSVRKFSKEVGVPRVKNTKSMKHKNKDFIENNQEELVTELIERDIKEIVKEYETNPYFRTKLNILLKELDEYKKQEIISNEIKEKKNPEKKD